jgi:twitching motility protein PilI
MAKKDALKELQVRLAERLQAVRDQPREAGWLAVEVAGVGVLLPLGQAGEIHNARQLTVVPHARPWLVGVANLRGQLHAVVDLARFLGLREESQAPAGAQLVALNPGLRLNCALRVDRLLGLRDAARMQIEPADGAPQPAFAGARWRDAQGRQWQALDLAALAADARFLDVAEAQPT